MVSKQPTTKKIPKNHLESIIVNSSLDIYPEAVNLSTLRMLNSRMVLSNKGWFLGLGIVGIVAIANTLFSLEHDWHLLSVLTLMIGGTLLFVNVRQSVAAVIEQPKVIDRSFLFKGNRILLHVCGLQFVKK